ncbi:non-ribosomal peptide synthetase [Aspergillus melleus]|uniref:non-ribosomal peptide synthetase n=1 Tax=Aspergillus melleus TaxID=138277 RepID=UPI001E8EECFE|nr:uncharacterized protein LDX57_006742 [Aspergillus melleus]KAH8429072.1 hypothetical protein LDX57_006742 [Aspergillus melleus]
MPVAMLDVLKTGGAFVPLDPSHPRARLHQIAENSRAKIVLTSAQNDELFTGSMAAILCLDQIRFDDLYPDQLPDLPSTAGPQNAAYVIFTSGSTGQPKGVFIEHQAFLTSALAHGAVMTMSESSRVLQFASYAFDMSLIEILTTLLFGACVCISGEYERLHTSSETMNLMQVDFAILTPAASRVLIPATLPHLRTLVLGGEELSEADAERWTRNGLRVMNAYGPTECSVVCSMNASVVPQAPESVGNAVGCRIWIIDEHNANRLAPLGCTGELVVEGPILARGYMDNPSLTAAFFLENMDLPHMADDHLGMSSRRFYKTGDIVRYGPDGSIYFVRRKDEQLKLRGHRLESSDIEHHIKSYLEDRAHVAVLKHRVPDLMENETSSGDFLAALICNLDDDEDPPQQTHQQQVLKSTARLIHDSCLCEAT